MIDLHCHVLAGIDDGPRTIEESIALARAAADNGTSTLLATPHVSRRYPNAPDTIARLVDELNGRIASEGIKLEVLPGAEIAISYVRDIEPASLARLGLGGSSWLLVEPPFTPTVTGFEPILSGLQHAGHRIVLAHPERCPAFHREPDVLASLVRGGVLTSVTAGALVGSFGGDVRRFALELVRDGLVHNVASDAHDAIRRPPSIAAELEQAGLDPLLDWLTRAVPAAILADEAPPERPKVALPRLPARRLRWLRTSR